MASSCTERRPHGTARTSPVASATCSSGARTNSCSKRRPSGSWKPSVHLICCASWPLFRKATTASVWKRGAELGWTSLLVPEESGGGSVSEHGVLDLALVAYQFGLHAAPGPLLGSNVVAAAIGRWGSAPQRAGPLQEFLNGHATGTWAMSGTDPGIVATETGDGFELEGIASPVEGGAGAAYILVTARTGSAVSQFLVPRRHRGRPDRSPPQPRHDETLRPTRVRPGAGAPLGPRRRRRPGGAGGGLARRPGGVDPGRGDVRRHAVGPRDHAGVGVQPLLVRTTACVLPGGQASLRRHEVVARGESRHRGGSC